MVISNILPRSTIMSRLMLLYCVLYLVDCKLLDNVCHKDDLDCLHPNIDKTGNLVHDKCLMGNTLIRLLDVSLLECVKECMATSQCTGINYRKNWKICDVTNKQSGTFVNELECVYSDIDTWPKELGGSCYNNNSPAGTSCRVKNDDTFDHPITYCKDLPVTPNATCIEQFGLYRNVGRGNKFTCNGDFQLIGKPFAVCKETGEWTTLFCCILKTIQVQECSDITCDIDGVYMLIPPGLDVKVRAFCDMHTDGHKWTVIQRRFNGILDFYKNWTSYENGFGSAYGEYYIGNKVIHAITSQGTHVLRVIMTDFDGVEEYAEYSSFSIRDSSTQYRLFCTGYSGTAGDSLTKKHNGHKFYTYDEDNVHNCSKIYKGAWWYNHCHESNLNGKYHQNGTCKYGMGMNWNTFHGFEYSMKSTIMMVRRA